MIKELQTQRNEFFGIHSPQWIFFVMCYYWGTSRKIWYHNSKDKHRQCKVQTTNILKILWLGLVLWKTSHRHRFFNNLKNLTKWPGTAYIKTHLKFIKIILLYIFLVTIVYIIMIQPIKKSTFPKHQQKEWLDFQWQK